MIVIKFISSLLSRFPKVKILVKNTYQLIGLIVSNKKTNPSDVKQISCFNYEHLFGYYDKIPWSKDGEKIIYQRVYNAHKIVVSCKKSEIILKDILLNEEKILSFTSSWNVQQGSMIQWMGPDFNRKVIFNDFREGAYCSVIIDIFTGLEKIIHSPIYTLGSEGKIALTLDFSRLNTFRPGYGYSNIPDSTSKIKVPSGTAIWSVDIDSDSITPIISYDQLLKLKYKQTMEKSFHKVNHIMINPSSNLFMFLHRWKYKGVKYDRLIVSDIHGKNLSIVLDENMVSHCNWLDERRIIAWANTMRDGHHYYIIDVLTGEKKIFMEEYLKSDGHPSISPNKKFIVTDTYPNFKRKSKIIICDLMKEECHEIANIYSNFRYLNNSRCDLHPRWNWVTTEICFDGSQNKKRQVYTMNVEKRVE